MVKALARKLTGLAPAQGIICALIERPNAEAVEPLLVDLERAANEKLRRQHLDGVFDRLGGTLEARIAHRPLAGLARACVKLGGSSVVERTHLCIKACNRGVRPASPRSPAGR